LTNEKPMNPMKHNLPSSLALALAAVITTSSASAEVTFDFVEIGNPGNAAKSSTNHAAVWDNSTIRTTDNEGVGAVAYTYSMARDKVTIAQYTEFLNAKAKYLPADPNDYYTWWDNVALDTYQLWNPRMVSYKNSAGIKRAGAGTAEDPFTYTYFIQTRSGAGTVEDPYVYTETENAGGNRPVTYVSWLDAARFANWMHNGQGDGDTEDGAYTMNGISGGFFPFYTADPAIPGKQLEVPKLNGGATFRVPSGDEWVKAAYYDPTMVNADTSVGGYWLMGNKSNAFPVDNNNVGDLGAINCRAGDFAVTPGNNSQDANINYLTDVGAYGTGSRSAYGINDMAGLTWDWNDRMGALAANSNQPARRQGSWLSAPTSDQMYQPRGSSTPNYSNIQASNAAHREDPWVGFRLAIPPAAPEIAIEQNAVDIPAYVVDWAALGNPNPNATVEFGTAAIGSDADLVFTIKNTGSAALNLSGAPDLVAISGDADFTVHAQPASSSVAVAGSTTFTVRFSPQVLGARSATITIANDDWDEGTFTFNVTGEGSEGSAGSAFDTWADTGTLGPVTFDGDLNGDGVQDGMAFLLGVANPDDDATGNLPTVSETAGGLVLTFSMLDAASSGTAALSVEHSSDLGIADDWVAVLVPDATPDPQPTGMTFAVSENMNPALNDVVATILSSEADDGKLFGRLKATE